MGEQKDLKKGYPLKNGLGLFKYLIR